MRVILIGIAILLLAAPQPASAQAKKDDCVRAVEVAEVAASALENQARALMQCAAAGNFSNTCSAEFNKLIDIQMNYEEAALKVEFYCAF